MVLQGASAVQGALSVPEVETCKVPAVATIGSRHRRSRRYHRCIERLLVVVSAVTGAPAIGDRAHASVAWLSDRRGLAAPSRPHRLATVPPGLLSVRACPHPSGPAYIAG